MRKYNNAGSKNTHNIISKRYHRNRKMYMYRKVEIKIEKKKVKSKQSKETLCFLFSFFGIQTCPLRPLLFGFVSWDGIRSGIRERICHLDRRIEDRR